MTNDRLLGIAWWTKERLMKEWPPKRAFLPGCDFCSKDLDAFPCAVVKGFYVTTITEGRKMTMPPPWVCCSECSKKLGLIDTSSFVWYRKVINLYSESVKKMGSTVEIRDVDKSLGDYFSKDEIDEIDRLEKEKPWRKDEDS